MLPIEYYFGISLEGMVVVRDVDIDEIYDMLQLPKERTRNLYLSYSEWNFDALQMHLFLKVTDEKIDEDFICISDWDYNSEIGLFTNKK